ncbi:hypothetical protein QZM22_05265 [Burkholderia oklahomensis]|uniref:hypothetical protein n=1 Tax=Burkholderia oklahomensis TaxID=342113 RepID=UPI00264DC971|nr:hypothetical protein [Burkholderia oklahomensis]MDN7671943.1 hypothetical protein [Burkholderia oklahomensis]
MFIPFRRCTNGTQEALMRDADGAAGVARAATAIRFIEGQIGRVLLICGASDADLRIAVRWRERSASGGEAWILQTVGEARRARARAGAWRIAAEVDDAMSGGWKRWGMFGYERPQSVLLSASGADDRRWMAECRMPNAECRMPNAECRMPNAECRMPNAECRMSNVECRTSNVECRMSNAG